MRLRVFRLAAAAREPRYDSFEFEPTPGMTVLAALFHIQDRFDDSLSFRYSCRGAVCGSCAMLIDKVPRLACRTQVAALLAGEGKVELKPYPALSPTEPWEPTTEVLVEPLPHLPVLNDLIVDMTKFFEFYRGVEPILKPTADAPDTENRMSPTAVAELEQYTNCILCANCFGACPVDSRNPDYLGPAALAKLYRFHLDPRDRPGSSVRLETGDRPDGWWACEFHANCRTICPRGVPPNLAIGKARAALQKLGRKSPDR